MRVRVRPLKGAWGEYDGDDGVISLDPTALTSKKSLKETLRHEMIHAALQISGVGYGRRYDEEQVVRCMEGVFFPAWARVERKL